MKWVLGVIFGLCGLAMAEPMEMFEPRNLVAWCIVPFDAAKRGPEERAQMLERLGMRRLAYDWRARHIASFDEEVVVMKRHGIELVAWWMSRTSAADNEKIFGVIERHGIHPQLWIALDDAQIQGNDQQEKVAAAAAWLRPLAERAGRLGCKLALYNHGGWFGEPENQVEIIKALGLNNVGIVYNFHHGQAHIGRFPEMFALIKPHLLALNLNGMNLEPGGGESGQIIDVGSGTRELGMLREVVQSGWSGPVGILNHRDKEDSEVVLKRNLAGLAKLVEQLRSR